MPLNEDVGEEGMEASKKSMGSMMDAMVPVLALKRTKEESADESGSSEEDGKKKKKKRRKDKKEKKEKKVLTEEARWKTTFNKASSTAPQNCQEEQAKRTKQDLDKKIRGSLP